MLPQFYLLFCLLLEIFFFFSSIHSIWKFMSQGSNLSHSCDLYYSWGIAGSLPCCTTAGTPLLEFLIDRWQRGITEQNTNMITNDIRTSSSWTCVQRPEIHEKNKLSLHFEIFPSITSSPFEIDTENYLDWS